MPEGFTHFPHAGTGPSFPSPSSIPTDRTQESNAPPPIVFSDMPVSTAQGTMEMQAPNTTQEFQGFGGGTQGLAPPPLTGSGGGGAWEDLPQSAQGFSDLPQSAQGFSDLPQSAQGFSDLPQSATNLPQSATNLPQSATNLPQSATNLPQSAAAAGAAQFGTMAMSGLDVNLGGGSAADPFGVATGDLPASARGAGTSVLDTMAQTDDIWAAPDAVVQQRAETQHDPFAPQQEFGTQAMPAHQATEQKFATEPISAQEPWERPAAPAATMPGGLGPVRRLCRLLPRGRRGRPQSI